MSVDPFGEVAACVHRNPTTGPTLLREFADWSDEKLPAGESVWDISRWIAAPQHRRAAKPRWPTNHQRELMIGILAFGLSRGLTQLTMLAERIAQYGWPLRILGAPRAYGGGKGTAVAAEIEVGLHVLALTRAETGVMCTMLVEIDSRDAAPALTPALRQAEADALRDIAERLGHARLRQLADILVDRLAGADDRPRAVELDSAMARLFESAGLTLGAAASPGMAPPGTETARSFDRAAPSVRID